MTVLGQPTITYGYDNADRLTQVTRGSASVGITYDVAGRRTNLTVSGGITAEYSYNNADQLTAITYKKGVPVIGNVTSTYDAAGNRSSLGGSWGRTGLPQAVSTTAYNDANRLTTWGTSTLTYDFNGNLTSDGTNAYTWDARDELTTITGGVSATFKYDAVGRRFQKVVSGTTTEFLYDRLNL
jgi:YD repeat-containing protein